MSCSPRCRGRAFTLVELLVAVAIMALLITILMPALSRAKVLAYTVKCQTNLHKLGRAAQQYASFNRNFVPRDYWYGCDEPWNTGQYGHYQFAAKLLEYVGGKPWPFRYSDDDHRIYKELKKFPVFKCPCVDDKDFVLTYVVNGTGFEYYEKTGGYTSGAASSIDDLPASPQDISYIMEANINMLDPFRFGIYDVLYPGNMPFHGKVPNENPRAVRHDDKRHAGRTTLVFFDGHTEPRELHPTTCPSPSSTRSTATDELHRLLRL